MSSLYVLLDTLYAHLLGLLQQHLPHRLRQRLVLKNRKDKRQVNENVSEEPLVVSNKVLSSYDLKQKDMYLSDQLLVVYIFLHSSDYAGLLLIHWVDAYPKHLHLF